MKVARRLERALVFEGADDGPEGAGHRSGVDAPPRQAHRTDGGRLLHTLDDAASFFVFPAGGETGSVLLTGRWSMEEIPSSEPIVRR